MTSSYHTMQLLIGERIISRSLPLAHSTCEQLGLMQPNRNDDRKLLQSTRQEDAGALLCLRCRVSHALADEVYSLYNSFKRYNRLQSSQLDLRDIAVFALHDEGKPRFYRLEQKEKGQKGQGQEDCGQKVQNRKEQVQSKRERKALPYSYFTALAEEQPTQILPLTLQVICTYRDNKQANLATWASRTLRSHQPLKVYLRDMHGILMISDWALLKDTSPRRVAEAWNRYPSSLIIRPELQPMSKDDMLRLHAAYGQHYGQDRQAFRDRCGRNSGYEPSDAFLHHIAPQTEPDLTRAWLQALAQAIRRLMASGEIEQQQQHADTNRFDQIADPRSSSLLDSQEPDWTDQDVIEAIEAALQRAMEDYLPSVLVHAASDSLCSCLWRGFGQGLSNAPNAERCGTTRGTISKKLTPTKHAETIALKAAEELKRHPAFTARFESVAALEKLQQGLQLYLLKPLQQEDLPLLNQWVQNFFALLDAARQQALDQVMPTVLAGVVQDSRRHCLWCGYAQGLSHAAIGERCGCSTDNVERQLSPRAHSDVIATVATEILRQQSILAPLARTADGRQQLHIAMRNQLLNSELKQGVAPLPAWIQYHLPPQP